LDMPLHRDAHGAVAARTGPAHDPAPHYPATPGGRHRDRRDHRRRHWAYDLDGEDKLFTELQVGSYIFMDVTISALLLDGSNVPAFETALFVATAVVSTMTDAGLKAFATDGPAPEVAIGAPEGSRYQFFGDEHGKLILPDGAEKPPLGTRIECVTPHCDPTVNLYDIYHVVRGGTLIDIWPIDARGKPSFGRDRLMMGGGDTARSPGWP